MAIADLSDIDVAPLLASVHSGIGAQLYDGGVSFRVWAPFATKVFVAGSFNDWSAERHPLVREPSGYWSRDISCAGEGDQYKYVVINGENKFWRIDPRAQDVSGSVGNGVIVSTDYDWQDGSFQMPPWNELVLYEMHIGTFHDQPGGAPGTLAAATGKLSHLQELGVNAIQIMPPFEFPGGFSWGYNPAHLFAIEDDYGGPRALKQFVERAHQLGIAVLFDVVYNHFGPSDLSLWQFDGWNENGGGGIYFYNDWRSETPWGPRPDYGRAEVRQFIRDNALYWLNEFHIDGLRWDATAYMRNVHGRDHDAGNDLQEGWQLMQWVNHEINSQQPWKISIAEDMRGSQWITKSTGDGGAGFDAQWSPDFVHPVRETIIEQDDRFRDMYRVKRAIEQTYNGDVWQRVIYTESHDEVANGKARVPTEIWPGNAGSYFSRKRSTLGALLTLTSPGIPMLFQGQELLEDQWFRDTDPLDWSRKQQFAGIFQMYRDLIQLRRNWHNNTRGLRGRSVNVYHVNQSDKVLAMHRWHQGGSGDDVVVLVNFADRRYDAYQFGLPRSGRWVVRFNSDWRGYGDDFGDTPSLQLAAQAPGRDDLPFSGSIPLGPYSGLILSQD